MKFFNNIQLFIKRMFLGKKRLHEENVEILNLISCDIKDNNFEIFDAYNKILKYNLFDEEYYLSQCEFKPEIDSLLHYLYIGHRYELNPCKIFDTTYYRSFNKNVGNKNPLVYFINRGIYEGIIQVNEDIWQPPAINRFEMDDIIEKYDGYGINKEKKSDNIIVSLTSYPKRIDEVKYTIYSLLNQDIKPDKVVLWLSSNEFPCKEENLPDELLKLENNGLTIKWCEYNRSYKKLLPSLKEYSDSIIVTADDDLYYPPEWLKILYTHHRKYPSDIVTHRSRRIAFENNDVKNYIDWEVSREEMDASYLNFFTTGGGTLFPPDTFKEQVFDTELYEDICPTGDDMWFWSMAVLNNKKIRVVPDSIWELTYVNPARDLVFYKDTLWSYNETHNDEHFRKLLNEFPEVYDKIKKDNFSGV